MGLNDSAGTFQSVARSAERGWMGGASKNRYLREHLISELLSGPGKEVIGWNHKSINRIQRVNRIRAKSTKGTTLAPQHLKHFMVLSSYSLKACPTTHFIGLTRYSNSLQ